VVFDDEPAWQLIEGYYQRDWKDSVPVAPESLVAMNADGALAARDAPFGARQGFRSGGGHTCL
jgi:hypothetical protein